MDFWAEARAAMVDVAELLRLRDEKRARARVDALIATLKRGGLRRAAVEDTARSFAHVIDIATASHRGDQEAAARAVAAAHSDIDSRTPILPTEEQKAFGAAIAGRVLGVRRS